MAALISLYALLTAARCGLALWYAGRPPRAAQPEGSTAVLQPILSGDPALSETLAANARELSDARLYWLVDEDDAAGQAAARRAAGPNVRILTGPPLRDGENPKVSKLARALNQVTESVTVVLDDDTRIDAAALTRLRAELGAADLVTGLPVFVSLGTVYERFIGGFVNGNAVLTYLPAAALGVQHTINGMIYAVRTAELRSLGGFSAIAGELTDDYAMARLYEGNGKRVRQTAVCVRVGMTVNDAVHCGRVLRRWFLFANRYLRENLGLATLVLIALPSILPLAGFYFGPWWGAVLLLKALINRILLWRIAGRGSSAAEIAFEVAADILAPLLFVSALVRPGELSWRSRRISLDGERIRYR